MASFLSGRLTVLAAEGCKSRTIYTADILPVSEVRLSAKSTVFNAVRSNRITRG